MGNITAQKAVRVARGGGKSWHRLARPARSGPALAVCAALAGGAALALPLAARAQQYWSGQTPDWRNASNWYSENNNDTPPGFPHLDCPVAGNVCGVNAVIDNPESIQPVVDGYAFRIHTLDIGVNEEGNILHLRNGGGIDTGHVILGGNAGSAGLLMLQHAGTVMNVADRAIIGDGGVGEIAMEEGAALNAYRLYLGMGDGSRGQLTLNGGSTVQAATNLWIAHGSEAVASVRVNSGSELTVNQQTYIGNGAHMPGAHDGNGALYVSDARVTLLGDLEMAGSPGATATLQVLEGGLVDVPSSRGNTHAAIDDGSRATILVSGDASRFNTGGYGMTLARNGGHAEMTIEQGGHVDSTVSNYISVADGRALFDGARTGMRAMAQVTVRDAGSVWNTGEVRLGANGGQAVMDILAGGQVNSRLAHVGSNGGDGYSVVAGRVTVDGEGSQWQVTDALTVGAGRALGELFIRNGGRVQAGTMDLSFMGRGHLTVEGEGSALVVDGLLDIGASQVGARFDVRDGAQVDTGSTWVGRGISPSEVALVDVSGASTVWRAGDVSIGSNNTSSGAEGVMPLSIMNLSGGATLQAESVALHYQQGRLVVGGGMDAQGNLQAATSAGLLDVDRIVFEGANSAAPSGRLIFNHNDADYTLAATFEQPAQERGYIDHVNGHTTLTGDSAAFTGTTTVTGGTLLVDGALGGAVTVSGGSFGGAGAAGDVTVADGATLTPGGMEAGTLTVGSLTLSDQSSLRFDLGTADTVAGENNDLVEVTGDLVLDGQLQIDAAPAFGNGVYRLFNYGGALTDNGLDFASITGLGEYADAEFGVQTAVGGQVNLVVGGLAEPILFWQGGSGTWDSTSENWTDANGTVSDDWSGTFGVFQGAGGTVTVVGEQAITGLQFAGDGYSLVGGEGGALLMIEPETILRVDAGVTATLSVTLAGDASLVRRDAGTLVLSGTNTYTGGTQLFEGVLEAASDAALGAASGAVDFRGGTLRLGDGFDSARAFEVGAEGGRLETSGDVRYAGTLSGSGAFNRVGDGSFEFAGDGSSYSGTFGAGGGTFQLSGTLGGLLDIAAGATLAGTGRAHDLRIAGRIAPGNSIGTLSASGGATFLPDSVFEVEVAADGGSDLLDVAGAVDVQGGTVEVVALDPQTSYVDGSSYTFLRSGAGLTGSFDALVENSAFLDFTLGYTADSAFLTLAQVAVFPDVAQTFNQRQASIGLAALDRTEASDSLAAYNAILVLDEAPARAAFDASSGEIYPSLLQDLSLAAQARGRSLIVRSHAAAGEGRGLWGGAMGRDGHVAGDGNAARSNFDSYGFELGMDYRGAENAWAAGARVSWLKTNIAIDDRASSASGDGWALGGYARYGTGHAGFSASVAFDYAEASVDTARSMAFGTLSRTTRAALDTNSIAASAELRYGLSAGGDWTVGPVASLDYGRGKIGGFVESGADALDLSSDGARSGATRYGGGAFASWQGETGSFSLSAQYVTGKDRFADAVLTLDGAPTTPFTIRSPLRQSDGALLDLTAGFGLGRGWRLGADASALFADGANDLRGSLTIGWRF